MDKKEIEKKIEGLDSDIMVCVERVMQLEEKIDILFNKHLNRMERQ